MTSMKGLKITAIAGFIMLGAAALLAYRAPMQGYELSIYAYVPPASWGLIIGCILCGLLIVVSQAVVNNDNDSRFWLVGLALLTMAIITFVCIPYTRGYTLWQGDNITHQGYYLDILKNNHFAQNNYYPIAHIMAAMVTCFTGLTDIPIANLSGLLFQICYVLSMYLLVTVSLPEKGQRLLAVSLIVTMPAGIAYLWLTANAWAQFAFPLVFYLLLKIRNTTHSFAYSFLLLIALITQPFFHPLQSLMVILAIAIFSLAEGTLDIINRRKFSNTTAIVRDCWLFPALLEIVIFIIWVLSFSALRNNLRKVYEQIYNGIAPGALVGINESLAKIGIHGASFFELLIRLYGVELLLITLALIGLVFMCKEIKSGDGNRIHGLTLTSAVFLSYGFFYLLTLIGIPGSDPLGGYVLYRMQCYWRRYRRGTLFTRYSSVAILEKALHLR